MNKNKTVLHVGRSKPYMTANQMRVDALDSLDGTYIVPHRIKRVNAWQAVISSSCFGMNGVMGNAMNPSVIKGLVVDATHVKECIRCCDSRNYATTPLVRFE